MNIDWPSIGGSTIKVIVVGVLFGAGLPALFAIGMRLWDVGEGGEHADGGVTRGRPAALIAAWAVFAVVGAAIVYGVLFIAAKTLDHYLGITLPI